MKLEFAFAQYTEITDLVFEMYPNLKHEGYERFFICPDTHDFWICRILKGYGEDYEEIEGSYILERNKIGKDKNVKDYPLLLIKKVIHQDQEDGCNWDYKVSTDIEKLISMVDGGFGILNLKE
jgi:hypothetical protein